jgi:hypothetical protein
MSLLFIWLHLLFTVAVGIFLPVLHFLFLRNLLQVV